MGKIHLRVCKTLSCMLAGAEETGKRISEALNCKMGETRDDGEVSIEWVECLACCDKAPVVMVGNKLHTGVSPDKVDSFVSELKVPTVAKT
jgi:NADH-quinone oxidoreductase subunit E